MGENSFFSLQLTFLHKALSEVLEVERFSSHNDGLLETFVSLDLLISSRGQEAESHPI